MATVTARIASVSQNALNHLALLLPSPPARPTLCAAPVAPLMLSSSSIEGVLAALHCPDRTIEALSRLHNGAQKRLQEIHQAYFTQTLRELELSGPPVDTTFERALRLRYTRDYEAALRISCDRLLDEVQSARHRAAAVSALESRTPFTSEALAVLERAFETQDTLNRAERKQLADATGLGEKQVGTWFANKRQRREKAQRERERERASPYDSSLRPRGRRDFSGSSASSLSSLSSACSDTSTAASSIEGWVSSSASSTVSYESDPSYPFTRETSPQPSYSSAYPDDLQVDSPPQLSYVQPQQGYRVASACGPPSSWPSAPLPSFSTTLPTPTPTRLSFAAPAQASSIHPFYSTPVSVPSSSFTFDQPPPPPSPTTARVLSSAPFLQGFDFEQDPQDGAFWAQFLQSGIGEELGLGAGFASAGDGGVEAPMGLLLPMPQAMEEDVKW